MRRIQMNGEHAELFTFHLKVGLLTRKHEKRELAPFGECTAARKLDSAVSVITPRM